MTDPVLITPLDTSTVEWVDCSFPPCFTACGGSLIHEDIVLTAGHCYDELNSSTLMIVGAYNNSKLTADAEVFHITDFQRHPKYANLSGVIQYDYLVLKLNASVSCSLHFSRIFKTFGSLMAKTFLFYKVNPSYDCA